MVLLKQEFHLVQIQLKTLTQQIRVLTQQRILTLTQQMKMLQTKIINLHQMLQKQLIVDSYLTSLNITLMEMHLKITKIS